MAADPQLLEDNYTAVASLKTVKLSRTLGMIRLRARVDRLVRMETYDEMVAILEADSEVVPAGAVKERDRP